MTTLKRMKFAYARGARIQATQGDCVWPPNNAPEWVTVGHPWFGEKLRIHPDDAHLEYGPITSAMRDAAMGLGWGCGAYAGLAMRAQWLDIHELAEATDDHFPDWQLLMLFMAEAMADEGL